MDWKGLVISMWRVILRNTYEDWIAKQFEKVWSSYHYRFVEKYLRAQVAKGNADYFIQLIKSFEEGVDN